ncbi:hypothetical protein L0Y65_06240 [Candidatus Micrarchaeota archaeon]|nr:hypothetical protein [Candidatus Micrarchaeota archaeon]
MGWVRYILLSLLFALPASFAVIIVESGDNGAAFLNETAALMCNEPDTQAVYKCFGNVVRVVSTVPGEGSTFYKPNGKVVSCPVVAPSEMGAECLQMMAPNYCPTQAECGASPAPEVFPGQNDTPEQTGDVDAYIVPGQAASDNATNGTPEPYEPEQKPPETRKRATAIPANTLEAPAATTNNLDSPLGYMIYVVLLLGVGAVGVLFMMFKNSLSDDDS